MFIVCIQYALEYSYEIHIIFRLKKNETKQKWSAVFCFTMGCDLKLWHMSVNNTRKMIYLIN